MGLKIEFTGATLAILGAGALAWASQRGAQASGSTATVVPFDPKRQPRSRPEREGPRRPPTTKPPMSAWQIGPMLPREAEQIAAHIREQAQLDPDSWHHRVETPSRGGRAIVLFIARRAYPGATRIDLNTDFSRGSRAMGDEDDPSPSGQRLREQQHVRRAPARSQLPFAAWVDETENLRGAPLVEGDPWRPVVDASESMTWYDLWLTGVPPDEAARR
jgi:hypothetical protein